jgi:polyphosphate glucokinase
MPIESIRKPTSPSGPAATPKLYKKILAVDVGGSGIKALIVDGAGTPLTDRARVETPVGADPAEYVECIKTLAGGLDAFDCVSVGFPGVVRDGRILTAANLKNRRWIGFDLSEALEAALGRPVRVMNDADLQGLGVIAGAGVEMAITLGTGFGTGIYLDGRVGPHLELAHHPFRKGETYEEQLGNEARQKIGNRKWSRRVGRAVVQLRELIHFDHLYIGGGNARHVQFDPPSDVSIVSNVAGLTGGAALWRE